MPQGRGISSFSEPIRGYKYSSCPSAVTIASEVPHGRGISGKELLIPYKSPSFPVRGVVSTDIDKCIINNKRLGLVYTFGYGKHLSCNRDGILYVDLYVWWVNTNIDSIP